MKPTRGGVNQGKLLVARGDWDVDVGSSHKNQQNKAGIRITSEVTALEAVKMRLTLACIL